MKVKPSLSDFPDEPPMGARGQALGWFGLLWH
jgi:hypothetical protein